MNSCYIFGFNHSINSKHKFLGCATIASRKRYNVLAVAYSTFRRGYISPQLLFSLSSLLRIQAVLSFQVRRQHFAARLKFIRSVQHSFSSLVNPLKPELNPICYLLALLAHHFLHVSRIRVKSLTLRLLMSYIYIYIWSTYS